MTDFAALGERLLISDRLRSAHCQGFGAFLICRPAISRATTELRSMLARWVVTIVPHITAPSAAPRSVGSEILALGRTDHRGLCALAASAHVLPSIRISLSWTCGYANRRASRMPCALCCQLARRPPSQSAGVVLRRQDRPKRMRRTKFRYLALQLSSVAMPSVNTRTRKSIEVHKSIPKVPAARAPSNGASQLTRRRPVSTPLADDHGERNLLRLLRSALRIPAGLHITVKAIALHIMIDQRNASSFTAVQADRRYSGLRQRIRSTCLTKPQLQFDMGSFAMPSRPSCSSRPV